MSARSRTSELSRVRRVSPVAALLGVLGLALTLNLGGPASYPAAVAAADEGRGRGRGNDRRHEERIDRGREVFRYDTFGDERQWTDRLRMHEVIESAIDPLTALSLGLKVDADALPDELLAAIAAGAVDLTDPATTVALIQLDAVVGVVGTVENV